MKRKDSEYTWFCQDVFCNFLPAMANIILTTSLRDDIEFLRTRSEHIFYYHTEIRLTGM